MLKVVEFTGGRAASDARLIPLLEALLEDARAGKIDSFAGVAFNRATHFGQRYAHNCYTMQGMGAVYLLLSWIREKWEAAPDITDPQEHA